MRNLFFYIVSLLVVTACIPEYDQMLTEASRAGKTGEDMFYATIETAGDGDTQTKVYADEQMRVLWNADDRIAIFNNRTYGDQYRFDGPDGATAGVFKKLETSDFITSNPLSAIYSVYPFDESVSISNSGVLSMNLPSVQYYKEDSFGLSANSMVSVTQNNYLKFRNLCGYLSFKLYGEGVKVKSITLEGNKNEKLAGPVTVVAVEGSVPTLTMGATAANAITLKCGDGVALSSSAEQYLEFWFVVPPTTFTQGFTVSVTDELGGVFTKSTSQSLTVSRNTISRMAPMEVIPDYNHTFVSFEDANFKAYCVEIFDKDDDGEISITEAKSVISIDVNSDDITSLVGIEYFTALKSLHCYGSKSTSEGVKGKLSTLDVSRNTALTYLMCSANLLTTLDVGNNTALTNLYCDDNLLTSLDVCNNTALTTLNCGYNQLTSLDVSNNTSLTYLYCSINQLASLDVSNNTNLVVLDCYENQLTSLDVSQNTMLGTLSCGSNQLTSLDVSHNTDLVVLDCYENQLTSLDVSHNTYLYSLFCFNNQLTSLDVSKNTALQSLSCNNNQLTSLDVSHNTYLYSLFCFNNQLTSLDVSCNKTKFKMLDCSPMDDASGKNLLQYLIIANGQNIPNITENRSTDYIPSETEIVTNVVQFADSNFKAYCVKYFDKDDDGEISIAEAKAVNNIIVNTDNISSLSGIEYFIALKALLCYGSWSTSEGVKGQLSSLDVSNNALLEVLVCGYNQLTTLDVSNNASLKFLDCGYNQLTSLDVSNNTALTNFNCGYNQLASLDVSNNASLTYLYCGANQLTSLDVSNNTSLTDLYCSINQLTFLDVSNNTSLTYLDCGANQLTSLDVSQITSLTELFCEDNQLTSLDVTNNTALTNLYCDNNLLTSLDVSNNSNMSSLNCQSNPNLTELWLQEGQSIAQLSYDSNVTTLKYKNQGPDPESNILFADAEVKRICVENWDTSGDGELSYKEAAAVTDLGSVFSGKNITSFNELEFFTGLSEINSNDFSSCLNLVEVYIPNNVISIGHSFSGCPKLQSFKGKYSSPDGHSLVIDGQLVAFAPAGISEYTVPSNVSIIKLGSMSDNSRTTFYSLESIIIPEGVTCIESNAIGSFAHVTNITLPNSLVSIGDNNFMNCSELNSFSGKFSSSDGRCLIYNGRLIAFAPYGLTEYEIPFGVTEICEQAFYSHQNITTIILPNSVEKIGNFAFSQCLNLKKVTLSSSLKTIGIYAFDNCTHLTEVTIPASVTTIGGCCFYGCTGLTTITVENLTPPYGNSGMFGNTNDCPIYVPNESVEAYKKDIGWRDYADRIQAIP